MRMMRCAELAVMMPQMVFGGCASPTYVPEADCVEGTETYTIEIDLPGMKREDVQIEAVENVLKISGERKPAQENGRNGYRHVERRHGRLERSIEFGHGFDAEKISATLENGVLRVTLPKREETKPKRIPVNFN